MSDSHLEIERKFLVRIDTPIDYDNIRIVTQYYLCVGDPEIRITWSRPGTGFKGREYFRMTAKSGSGLVRNEVNIPDLTENVFDELLEKAIGMVRKCRGMISGWEVDHYGGHLCGLYTAEVELHDVNDFLPELPKGLTILKEVTGDPTYSNGRLSTLTAEEAKQLVNDLPR